jgi:hypothetical protein
MRNDYETLRKKLTDINPDISYLAWYGIKIDLNGFITYNWQEIPHIATSIAKLGFFGAPSLGDKIALAIAVKQEQINSYIPFDEIERIARFFKVIVSEKMVKRMGEDFI